MKNKFLLLAGIVAFVAVVGFLIFSQGTDTTNIAVKTDPVDLHGAATESPIVEEEVSPSPEVTPEQTTLPSKSTEPTPGETDSDAESAIGARTDIPVLDVPVAKQDLVSSLFFGSLEGEKKYLSDTQQAELEETVLSKHEVEEGDFPNRQEYTVEWLADQDFDNLIPELSQTTVPLYAVARDAQVPVFEEVKRLANAFGITGTTLRMNESNFTTFDMQSGDLQMAFDFFKNTFQIPRLDILLDNKEDPALALEWQLYEKGLLRFPYSAVFANTSDGGKVVRFAPELELPVIRFDSVPPEGSDIDLLGESEAFPIGISEAIDARIDSQNKLRELYAFFPNLEKWNDVSLLDNNGIKDLLAAGEFTYGSAELQYPGALTLEERQEFYDASESDQLKITEGEIYDVQCGYFQEPEENYQLFYQPVCIAYGQGYVGDYAALFGAVISIAQ